MQTTNKEMRIDFVNGKPSCIVPYSEQNVRQYSKILGNEIKEIVILDNDVEEKTIKPVDTKAKITLTEAELNALIAQKVAELGQGSGKKAEPEVKIRKEKKNQES